MKRAPVLMVALATCAAGLVMAGAASAGPKALGVTATLACDKGVVASATVVPLTGAGGVAGDSAVLECGSGAKRDSRFLPTNVLADAAFVEWIVDDGAGALTCWTQGALPHRTDSSCPVPGANAHISVR